MSIRVRYPTFVLGACLLACSARAESLSPPGTILLLSDPGISLLQREQAVDFQPLRQNWIPQKPAHCGAASAVVVNNALRPENRLTQDGLFTTNTAHIIAQETVYRMGFTLDELTSMIRTRTGLDVEAHHAYDEDASSNFDAFRETLKRNRIRDDDHLILNFSRQHLQGSGTGNGHFSPVADYNADEDMVLILEVNGLREPYWISSRTLYEAMRTTDPVCDRHRGWMVLSIAPGKTSEN